MFWIELSIQIRAGAAAPRPRVPFRRRSRLRGPEKHGVSRWDDARLARFSDAIGFRVPEPARDQELRLRNVLLRLRPRARVIVSRDATPVLRHFPALCPLHPASFT